jgi:hypothetical protein
MGPPALLPIRRKLCCGFLAPLKIHRLCRVWTRYPWDPIATTVTTIPPRRLDASISDTSMVFTSAMLVLHIVIKQKLRVWSGLQWHGFHAKFLHNSSSVSPVETCGQTDGRHDQLNSFFLYIFCKGSWISLTHNLNNNVQLKLGSKDVGVSHLFQKDWDSFQNYCKKQSRYTPWRRLGEWKYSSYWFTTSALDGVSGQHHAQAALYPRGKDPRYPVDRRLGGPQSRSGHRG